MKRTFVVTQILLGLVLISGCGILGGKDGDGSTDSQAGPPDKTKTTPEIPDAPSGPMMVAMFTFTQMKQAFADATKVSPNDTDVRSTYQLIESSMPKDPTTELTPPMMGSVMRYADINCQKVVNKEAGQSSGNRLFFREVNFNSNSSQTVFTNKATFSTMLNRVTARFWGRSADAEELDLIYGAVQSVRTIENTKAISGLICTTVGSSQETFQL